MRASHWTAMLLAGLLAVVATEKMGPEPEPKPELEMEADDELDAEGFHIHPDLPDGHYNIELRRDGEHLVRRWAPLQKRWEQLEAPPQKRRERLEKRQGGTGQVTFLVDEDTTTVEGVSQDLFTLQRLPLPRTLISCEPDRSYNTLRYPLPKADYEASREALFNWCNIYKMYEGHVSLALNGTVAVYACQRKFNKMGLNICSKAEFLAVEARVDNACGNSSGYGFIYDWGKEYGRTWKGEAVCRRWNQFRYNQPARQLFRHTAGNGGKPNLFEGIRSEFKDPDHMYRKVTFESPPDVDYDDGVRDNYGHMYGPYGLFWFYGWNWGKKHDNSPTPRPGHKGYDVASDDPDKAARERVALPGAVPDHFAPLARPAAAVVPGAPPDDTPAAPAPDPGPDSNTVAPPDKAAATAEPDIGPAAGPASTAVGRRGKWRREPGEKQ
ncbi:hypothetical protein CDD83_4705 [Cordyceps sp. RAO-2017]|nr:hypothetical protein CDD83_4705 [Cordyceps sp. RAO-2017]